MFGMVDTSQSPALGVMVMVPCRNAATLLPIIQQHVRPGTVVWSDEWAAYRRVQQLPAVSQHGTVNHSIEFVNPSTGVHTQNIESYWNRVKTKFKRMKGVQCTMMSSYLDEFMWRERHGRTDSAASAETSPPATQCDSAHHPHSPTPGSRSPTPGSCPPPYPLP